MEIQKIKAKSRQSAVISGTGFLIILVTFLFTSFKLYRYDEEIKQKSMELKNISDSISSLQKGIDEKQKLIGQLVSEVNRLSDPSIQPKSESLKLPNQFSNGRQLYDFTLWITSSSYTLNKIRKVSYEFNHSTMILKTRESTNSSNGFLVSYRGWGCLRMVKLTITYTDGKTGSLFFDMCEKMERK